MSTVTCTFDGVVGAEIVWSIANGDALYVFYVDGTDLKVKRYSVGRDADAIVVATDITNVAQ